MKDVAKLQTGLEALIDHAMSQFIEETGCVPSIDAAVHELQSVGGATHFVPCVSVRSYVIPAKRN